MASVATVRARPAPVEGPDLAAPELYVNRELSWLGFSARVLAQARDPETPLLERCKFLGIFSAILDEFFLVRVAGGLDAAQAGRPPSTPDRLSREAVLDGISERVGSLVAEQSRIWHEELVPALAEADIRIASPGDLSGRARRSLDRVFERQIYPVLTPLAV